MKEEHRKIHEEETNDDGFIIVNPTLTNCL